MLDVNNLSYEQRAKFYFIELLKRKKQQMELSNEMLMEQTGLTIEDINKIEDFMCVPSYQSITNYCKALGFIKVS